MTKEELEKKAELWLKLRGMVKFPTADDESYGAGESGHFCSQCKYKDVCYYPNSRSTKYIIYYKAKCIRWLDTREQK